MAKAEHCQSVMLRAGIETDTTSHNRVMTECAEAGDVVGAAHWMSKTLTAGVVAITNSCYDSIVPKTCAKACDVISYEHWLFMMLVSGVEPGMG